MWTDLLESFQRSLSQQTQKNPALAGTSKVKEKKVQDKDDFFQNGDEIVRLPD